MCLPCCPLCCSPTPRFAVEHRGVRLPSFRLAPRSVLRPALTFRAHILLCLWRQAPIPVAESRLAITVQFHSVTTPVSGLQGPSRHDIHEVLAGRAKRSVQHPPLGEPCPANEVHEKILCPAERTSEVERPIALADQDPTGVNLPCFLLVHEPGGPQANRKTVRKEHKPRFSSRSRPRSLELQPLEIFSKFDPGYRAEIHLLKLSLEP